MADGGAVAWLERRQIGLYLAAIAAGGAVGVVVPGTSLLEVAIYPVLGLLLYATFLGVPFASVGAALRDVRFLLAVLVVNFVFVPAVAFGLSRFVAGEPALLFGVLLVLLTPCIDYVIVFSGLAGGASDRLLAAAPLLMVTQVLLLPVYLWLILGRDGVAAVDVGPFVEAFVVLIVIPLAAAAGTQALAARYRGGRRLQAGVLGAMVPLMMATLFVVVASQAAAVRSQAAQLVILLPLYAGYLLLATALGWFVGTSFGLDVASRRAVVFSGATRNSLVVLPLALALPPELALAPVVVVTQTLVELIGMVVLVRLVPALVPHAVRERPGT
jgi:ACR3 family arsenite transporter